MSNGDIKKLKTSWTKYDCVQFIEIIGVNDLGAYLNQDKSIDLPVLKSYLGISNLEDKIPSYWNAIQKFPRQKRLFALAAGIFTHIDNINLFASKFSGGNMLGEFSIGEGGKHMTNLRSALVVSGAAQNSYRRKDQVPYDLSVLFEEGDLGGFFKELLIERLGRIGYSNEFIQDNFIEVCYELGFHDALSLQRTQFKRWMEGKSISQVKEFSYNISELLPTKELPAFKVNQWLHDWDAVDFSGPMRRKPDPHFYIFNIDIRLLKRLSEVHRRRANKRRSEDTAIQRGLEEKRSLEIKRFVQGGFPWSTLSDSAKKMPENEHLKMPGVLPTAIVANILGPDEFRGNNQIRSEDLIKVSDSEPISTLHIPEGIFDNNWDPDLKPIEIIDGQHRLMAFDETEEVNGKYEVPVVAYYNLDRAWQAYLFYVINIKPKKINTSLGYDLYPLLRTQNWLENSKDGLAVYRETRAQELVEALWLYDESPWHNRINMLGVNEGNNISQAAFIRALSDTFLKRKARKDLSGLFTDFADNSQQEEIKWVRAQQAAFLILLWEEIAIHASDSNEQWAISLKEEKKELLLFDSNVPSTSSVKINDAFLSKNSMLSRDQGVTGISMFTNDFFFVAANYFGDFDFNELEWSGDIDEKQLAASSIDKAISLLRNSSLYTLIKDVAYELTFFDWRMPTAEFKDEVQQEIQKKFKGTGGYREVWKDLLKVFRKSNNDKIKAYSDKLLELTGE
jgi:DGQHR domain-containing protein